MSELKSTDAYERLLEIMAILRSPQGCPWDAAQTPEGLKRYLIEEAYEVLEAIDEGDPETIRDELGDLLLQIVFHARIFEERGAFDMEGVATAIGEKLIRRHPHVFGGAMQGDSEAMNQQWDRIKSEERRRNGQDDSPFGSIPAALPALLRARKVIEKSSRLKVSVGGSEHLQEMLARFEQEIAVGSAEEADRCLGELLFGLVASATKIDVDAEESLRKAIKRRLPVP